MDLPRTVHLPSGRGRRAAVHIARCPLAECPTTATRLKSRWCSRAIWRVRGPRRGPTSRYVPGHPLPTFPEPAVFDVPGRDPGGLSGHLPSRQSSRGCCIGCLETAAMNEDNNEMESGSGRNAQLAILARAFSVQNAVKWSRWKSRQLLWSHEAFGGHRRARLAAWSSRRDRQEYGHSCDRQEPAIRHCHDERHGSRSSRQRPAWGEKLKVRIRVANQASLAVGRSWNRMQCGCSESKVSGRLLGDRCRIRIGISTVMGQGLECREEHFVGKQLRGQNSLQHKSFHQGMNHTDQLLWRHG